MRTMIANDYTVFVLVVKTLRKMPKPAFFAARGKAFDSRLRAQGPRASNPYNHSCIVGDRCGKLPKLWR